MTKVLMRKSVANLRSFIIWTLRKASYRWAPRGMALAASRVARNQYKCATCEKLYTRKEVKVDHINPVVDPKHGWAGYDEFVRRMFCDVDGFQILCNSCHTNKTAAENKERVDARREAKRLLDGR